MLIPSFARQFSKDIRKMEKRGKYLEKVKGIIKTLLNEENLNTKYKDHKLIGNFKGRRECHIEPDCLLSYKVAVSEIIFERTGTHSDLFE